MEVGGASEASRKPNAADVRRSCRSEGDQQSDIKLTRGKKQQDCNRNKAKHEEKQIIQAGWSNPSSQPVPKHPRTDADVQQGQSELKLGEVIATIPKIDLNEKTVEYKDRSFTLQKNTEVIHRKVKGGTKINCYLKENQSRILVKTSTEGFGEETLGTHTVQTAQKRRSELVDATKLREA